MVSSRSAPLEQRTGWLLCALAITLYVAFFVHLRSQPFQDNPNHLARAVAMADLIFHHGARFGSEFQYHFLAVPYIFGDMILTTAVELFGPRGADGLWVAVVFLSLPASVLFWLRAHGIATRGQIFGVLLSLYLSTDSFFVMGFFEFRLGIAATLVALALAHTLRRHWTAGLFAAYCALVAANYFIHLAALLCLAAAVGGSAPLRLWLRSSSIRVEAALLAPIALMFAWHFGVAAGYGADTAIAFSPYEWGTVYGKLARLPSEFLRYSGRADWLMLALFALALIWLVRSSMHRSLLASADILEPAALCLVFLVLYVVLPVGYSQAYDVDVRPLVFIPLLVLLACLQLLNQCGPQSGVSAGVAAILVVLLVGGNLAYLDKHLERSDRWLNEYRQIVAAIPPGAHVMLVNTRRGETKSVNSLAHAGEFAVIDRGAFTADMFSLNAGNPMKYFRYIKRPYVPDEEEMWYRAWPKIPVDWTAVACDYDYLLVTKPFDAGRIHLTVRTVTENPSAALLAVPKSACGA
jgi:hypothetical protein